MDKTDRIGRYADTYLGDYGFESVLVRYRHRKCLDVLRQFRPGVVVEVGCGQELLFDAVTNSGIAFDRWVIVEPSAVFHAVADGRAKKDDRLTVINGFFEDKLDDIAAACNGKPDFILFSGMINEVEKPESLLSTARSLMHRGSVIHVNTANAFSLHRRLGQAMGILETVHHLSERNQRFEQYCVYDSDCLKKLVEQAGYEIVESGGYFLKLFSHTQMEACGDILTDDVLDGLFRLGQENPEWATEIFVNARLPDSTSQSSHAQ